MIYIRQPSGDALAQLLLSCLTVRTSEGGTDSPNGRGERFQATESVERESIQREQARGGSERGTSERARNERTDPSVAEEPGGRGSARMPSASLPHL